MFCACWVQLDGVDDDESHVTVVCECCFEYGPHLKQGGLVYIHSNKHNIHKMQNCCMSTCESNKAMEGQGDMCLGDGERGMIIIPLCVTVVNVPWLCFLCTQHPKIYPIPLVMVMRTCKFCLCLTSSILIPFPTHHPHSIHIRLARAHDGNAKESVAWAGRGQNTGRTACE